MIQFIDIPTEQTTSITDLLLSILSIVLGIFVYIKGYEKDKVKAKIWTWLFSLLSFAATMGFVAHGFKMSDYANYLIWQPLNLSLGLAISMFVVGVVYDYKKKLNKTLLGAMIVIAFFFYGITILIPDAFIVFIVYEAIAMLFALSMYIYLHVKKRIFGGIY